MPSKNFKVYVAGHKGMVGSSILNELKKNKNFKIITSPRSLDLRRQINVERFFNRKKPDIVIIAAAVVGGVYANNTYPVKFIYDNLMIQTNLINCSFKNKIKKLFFIGSSCIYPVKSSKIKEEDLLNGKLI